MRSLPGIVAGAAVALALASGGLARADEAAAEATYSRYQQAIEVARKCRKMNFDAAQEQAMADVISANINHQIGAKRLSLLTAAQRDARQTVKKKGCESAEAGELLGLFDAELAPALN